MKSNLKTFNDAINAHLERLQTTREIPMGAPDAVPAGLNQPFFNSSSTVKGVLQWGFSTWGVEAVIGIDAPQNRK